MTKILDSIFITNSAIWFEKDLKDGMVDFKPKISVDINKSSSETIEWLKNRGEKWVVFPKEISTARIYNHYWPSVRLYGKIIGSIKIGFDSVYIKDFDKIVKFPKKMAFIYDTFVTKENRGQGIAKFLISHAVNYSIDNNFEKIGCHIPPWNKSSIKAFEAIGFKKVNYVRNFRIFKVPIKIIKPADNLKTFSKGKMFTGDLPYV